jgi:hypothetical protein
MTPAELPHMVHTDRPNAEAMDRDHQADPYDPLLRAGWCRRCDQPCAWPPEPAEEAR